MLLRLAVRNICSSIGLPVRTPLREHAAATAVCGGSGFPSSNVTKPAAAAMETSGAVCNHSKGAASATMRPF